MFSIASPIEHLFLYIYIFFVILLCLITGLKAIADKLGLQLLAPRKKITVLLIGNHSAGKSSFINW